ncbi:MAG: ribosome-associated translation inhibitor RaiA [Fusobacterium sp.]|uniref:ribosome hibernation-promoting factor, HPF/YfiA family n=1 Tax=Fusobacterium sp. TaxID=68766 RepID=UPI0026DD889A|nr:ribosome-associated translation inhibitor RaiA [Fusobacterium sp.]MDO4690195.1 ribosome-associated translation inhibitor RaiA [Fusobacterium sp.]
MKLSIKGRQITLTDSIKKYAEEKISKIGKFNDSILRTDVTLSAARLKSGNAHVAEILVYLSGSTLKSRATEQDLYTAIDKAVDGIEPQLKKHKDKHTRAKVQDDTAKKFYSLNNDENFETEEKKLVKVYLPLKPMDVSEAILQLESLNKVFFAFINVETSKMAVVYKRKDGDYCFI